VCTVSGSPQRKSPIERLILNQFALSLSDLLERFLTTRNCMSLILKMKISAESGL
jgi:hypothetical protein